ncbi:DUF1640 domain-containing protein [Vibrio lentus]|mgnify:FL=1|jgi:ElaB/YqjD/DUF883 family membrane-anchored ribosome-binding protein|uniref:DUF1640 domain-containing protein n=1 Tax=Vibrio tasmaniensis TaxID=212663 RepID=A0A2N7NF82_9VIBR|nr:MULTISPECIES: DUF1640 domain-containing protein [Vibrio]KAA8596547.1 hypothetical protein F0Z19_4762 [Vibrio cyclitrophicus]MDH5928949.1 DUF1640 domain-containing protein [Vibrio lentus]PMK08556.1 DUF1640 domain-containing protein [Vibrio sp. 10N.261.54.E10]PMP11781.1 DUF1640 domain-containing protein [Vibrio tasmaniensis]PMP42513.1 DUF1640 domain-containing protein [Vibrio splendidus]
MSESSKVTLSVEELINLTAHAATQEQLNDTRKELDQKIEAVRHELSDKIDTVRNEVSSLKNLIIATAFAMIATVAGAAFWVGSHINV